jgi:hypothetical protein
VARDIWRPLRASALARRINDRSRSKLGVVVGGAGGRAKEEMPRQEYIMSIDPVEIKRRCQRKTIHVIDSVGVVHDTYLERSGANQRGGSIDVATETDKGGRLDGATQTEEGAERPQMCSMGNRSGRHGIERHISGRGHASRAVGVQ